MSPSAKVTVERLLSVQPWAPNLFSFRTTRDADFRFVAGQFARLGVETGAPASGDAGPDEAASAIVWRAFSVASPADAPHLDFFANVVPGGAFSPALARLRPGAEIGVERASYGFLTLDRFEPARDLWMLCTGTGLAPYLSILGEAGPWNQYRNVVVVHSVRYPNELAYGETLRTPSSVLGPATLHYVPVVTRRDWPGALRDRIPALLDSGALEARVGLPIERESSRVLLCGNPDMVSAARKLLGNRGLVPSRRGNPGQLAVENYW